MFTTALSSNRRLTYGEGRRGFTPLRGSVGSRALDPESARRGFTREKSPASNLTGYAAQFTYSATTTLPTAVAGGLQSTESPYVPTFSDLLAKEREEDPAARKSYGPTMDDGSSSTPSVDNSIPRSLSYKKFDAIGDGASVRKAIEFIRSTIPTRTKLAVRNPTFPRVTYLTLPSPI